MDDRCKRCLYRIAHARAPCPECGVSYPLHGWPKDGWFGMERAPLAQSRVRQAWRRVMARIPTWYGGPLLIVTAAMVAILGVGLAVFLFR